MFKIALLGSLILLSFDNAFPQNKLRLPSNLSRVFWKEVCSERCSETELIEWKKNFRVKTKDLNGDRQPEYFLTINHPNWCGAGSNCNTWIYRRVGRSFELIFDNKNPFVSLSLTNKYLNIESRAPMGFCDKNVQRYSVTDYVFKETKYISKGQSQLKCAALTP